MFVHLDGDEKVETVIYDCYERICNKLGGPRHSCCEEDLAKYRKTEKNYYFKHGDGSDEWELDEYWGSDDEWEEQYT